MGVTLRRSSGPVTLSAECPLDAVVGDMVYIAGDKTLSNLYLVDLCNIDLVNRRAAGMIASKHAADKCTIQLSGEIFNVYQALTPNRPLFLGTGTGGRLTQLVPSRPTTGKRYIEQAGFATSADSLFLNIQRPLIMRAP